MLIFKDAKFIEAKFSSEQELEDIVLATYEHFFGPSSILIPKAKIKASDGSGTIPDAFAIDLATRQWYVVEAELAHHSLWNHIAPQVTKQLLASGRKETRQLLTEILIGMVTDDPDLKEKFADEGISEIDIRKVVGEIFEQDPIVGMPIDAVTQDLKGWAATLRNDVKLWTVRKFVQLGSPDVIAYDIPEEYKPDFDTTDRAAPTASGIKAYDVSLSDLIAEGLLEVGSQLSMGYKPRGGEQRTYAATVCEDGSLQVNGETFSSPSYAALFCIQEAGSKRTTVNGWTSWRDREGKFLAQIRTEYLDQQDATED